MSAVSLFCFGLGYSAGFLARAVVAAGGSVGGTSRDPAPADAGTAGAYPLQRFDRAHPLAAPASLLAGTTHLLISVPPDERGCPVFDRHGSDIAALERLAWVGYLSSTNVYGDRGGAWVDEATPLRPSGARGRNRVQAEAAWLSLQRERGVPVHIFRLAGIYGPGRNALASVRAGMARRIVKPGQVFSRIHVADVVAVLRASMARPDPGAIYNVCDELPTPPEEVVAHAAAQLGLAPPPTEDFATASLSPMARSFYDDNKRVANRRLREELGVTLLYPSYREGLAALLESEMLGADRSDEERR